MLKQKKLTDQEAHKLFAKFAAPIFRAAKTPSQQKGAQRLAQTLWQAFLTGPEIETSVFENLEKYFSLKTEDMVIIKERYYLVPERKSPLSKNLRKIRKIFCEN